jgi:hypothetical protein
LFLFKTKKGNRLSLAKATKAVEPFNTLAKGNGTPQANSLKLGEELPKLICYLWNVLTKSNRLPF